MILNFVNYFVELPFLIFFSLNMMLLKLIEVVSWIFLLRSIPVCDCTVISLSIFLSVDTAVFPGFCNCE